MIAALHGFLGVGSDWNFLQDAGYRLRALDLLQRHPLPSLDLLSREAGESDLLIGYSMGARLALHLLLGPFRPGRRRIAVGRRFPSIRAAVIVSAGLGIKGEAEREARRESDEAWARRFESDEWESLVEQWNAQDLFTGQRHPLPRTETDFDRQALAAALRQWSPAVLPPLFQRLQKIELPLLWVAGANDEKYALEGRWAVDRLPRGELWICPDAGHRVPWEQPSLFLERLRLFRAAHNLSS